MMPERKIPKFKTEAQEAAWWFTNRKQLDRDLIQASRAGTLRRLTTAQLSARVAKATRTVSIRLAEEDIALARDQAAKKGLPYQTYLKSLLHVALRRTA